MHRWYREHGRHDLPWRLTRDPYAVLVSEMMLQQTQLSRVLPYYERWLERWPTVAALATDSPAEAIREWAGLGYNRRALNLHRAAVTTVERFGGRLPTDPALLRVLAGIGEYTAAAVGCFAGEAPVAVVDTNVARVIVRARLGRAVATGAAAAVSKAAVTLLPRSGARDHNLALMDLGAMVCTSRAPGCVVCPLRKQCAWLLAGSPSAEAARRTVPRFETTARFARGRIVDGLRGGPMSEEALAAQLPPQHGERLADYLAALERDGIVVADDGSWRLPGVREG